MRCKTTYMFQTRGPLKYLMIPPHGEIVGTIKNDGYEEFLVMRKVL
jgi:hypothetical protein